jgi:hypothetical protein
MITPTNIYNMIRLRYQSSKNQHFLAPKVKKVDSVTNRETDKTVPVTCAVPAASQFVHPISLAAYRE